MLADLRGRVLPDKLSVEAGMATDALVFTASVACPREVRPWPPCVYTDKATDGTGMSSSMSVSPPAVCGGGEYRVPTLSLSLCSVSDIRSIVAAGAAV